MLHAAAVRTFLCAALPCVAALAPALRGQQQDSPAILQQRLADKRAAPFLRLAPWHLTLPAAQHAAARDGKLILVHCTRSFTPCGTSIRCEREVLAAPEFAALAERVVLYCHITAHLDPAEDRLLAATRGSGWPHHVVMDASGRVLGVHESHQDKSVTALATLVDAATEFLHTEADCARAIAAANRTRLEAGLTAGALDLATARALFAECGTLPPADAERLAAAITDLEVADVLAGADRFDEAARPALGAVFHGMWRVGKRPAGRNAVRDFWGGILLHLETREQPDLDLYRDALARLESAFGEARGYRAFLDARREALARMTASRGVGVTTDRR